MMHWGQWNEPRHGAIMAAAWSGDWERVRDLRELNCIEWDRERLIGEFTD
jgi:hypothetical protein